MIGDERAGRGRGETGAAGETGATGETGRAGDTGAAGVPGTAGRRGERGAEGVAGRQGEAGVSGREGEAGTAGLAGAAGAQGEPGTVGATGVAGTAGRTGGRGATGRAGAALTRGRTLALFGFVVVCFLVLAVRSEINSRQIGRNQQLIEENQQRTSRLQFEQCTTRNDTARRQNALLDAEIAAERLRPEPNEKRLHDLFEFKTDLLDCGPPPPPTPTAATGPRSGG